MTSSQAAPTDPSEKTCVITGASGGIGRSVSEHFLALGAKVLATDISDASAMADLSGLSGGKFEYQTFNLTDAAGHRGEALVAHHCAYKGAVISNTQSTALALSKHGVRVNAISPGVVDTPMWDSVDALFAKYENHPLGENKREVGENVLLGYMGASFDIARVAVFLASNQSGSMTAQTLGVDGGSVLR